MNKLYCWWCGCASHPQDPSPPDELTCKRCGEFVTYADLVGDTPYYRMMDQINYVKSLWRKCPDCGRRFGHDNNVDHIPF